MEPHKFGNSDLMISAIGLGCYGMLGAYGPADDAESIATIRRALDLGVNFLDTSASYGTGHNHRLIGEAIRGRRQDVVIHSKSGSPRDGGADAIARRKNATLAQLSIAWPMAQGKRAGVFIVPIPGAKSRKHIEENVRAADIVLTAEDLAEIDRIVPPGAASGTRYPIGQMYRVNV